MATNPNFTINVGQLHHEVGRAIKGETTWNALSNSYMRDLIQIYGLGYKAANEIRDALSFKFYTRNKVRHLQVLDKVHGTEILMVWEDFDDST